MFVRDKFLFHFIHILLVLFQTRAADMGQLLEGIHHPVSSTIFFSWQVLRELLLIDLRWRWSRSEWERAERDWLALAQTCYGHLTTVFGCINSFQVSLTLLYNTHCYIRTANCDFDFLCLQEVFSYQYWQTLCSTMSNWPLTRFPDILSSDASQFPNKDSLILLFYTGMVSAFCISLYIS